MRNIIFTIIAVAMLSIPAVSSPANAAMMGCLLGAAGGGFGGAQIGNGNGKLALTAIGTLLGCGVGSAIQDRDQQQYQQQYVPRQPRFQQQPRQQFRSRYNEYRQQQVIYQQPAPRIVYQLPAPKPAQRACPYSREYQDTVTIGGKEVQAYGRACSYDGGRNWDLGPLTPAQ